MARNVNIDWAADCHASGAVPTAAFLVRGPDDITICAHHLIGNAQRITDQGWTIIPVKRSATTGVGTESTPNHFALETETMTCMSMSSTPPSTTSANNSSQEPASSAWNTSTSRPVPTKPDPWVCATCGTRYVVPSLARDCEAKHAIRQAQGR